MNEQKEKHIQAERNKIRAKRAEQAIKDAKKYKQPKVKFERPQEGKIEKRIGGMDTFHVEKARKRTPIALLQKGNIRSLIQYVQRTRKTQ